MGVVTELKFKFRAGIIDAGTYGTIHKRGKRMTKSALRASTETRAKIEVM